MLLNRSDILSSFLTWTTYNLYHNNSFFLFHETTMMMRLEELVSQLFRSSCTAGSRWTREYLWWFRKSFLTYCRRSLSLLSGQIMILYWSFLIFCHLSPNLQQFLLRLQPVEKPQTFLDCNCGSRGTCIIVHRFALLGSIRNISFNTWSSCNCIQPADEHYRSFHTQWSRGENQESLQKLRLSLFSHSTCFWVWLVIPCFELY